MRCPLLHSRSRSASASAGVGAASPQLTHGRALPFFFPLLAHSPTLPDRPPERTQPSLGHGGRLAHQRGRQTAFSFSPPLSASPASAGDFPYTRLRDRFFGRRHWNSLRVPAVRQPARLTVARCCRPPGPPAVSPSECGRLPVPLKAPVGAPRRQPAAARAQTPRSCGASHIGLRCELFTRNASFCSEGGVAALFGLRPYSTARGRFQTSKAWALGVAHSASS